ncbi:MAG TPA: THUMP domain-containing protein [Spirochaetia bacterium]|nr:THUMP domain-containing protein [Spirochaetia bacterium]
MEWPGDGTLIATCGGGAENTLEQEIISLGLAVVSRANGMVRFRGDAQEMIDTNLRLRTASRVLVPVATGPVTSYEGLYRLARGPAWHKLIPAGLTIAVSAVTRDRTVNDSRLAALKTKDAIVDTQRKTGSRSSIDRRHPDVPIALHIADRVGTLSLDSSGGPLHERGYRTEAGEAPLRETVAAAMLLISGWDPSRPLLDPFCGSGTIVIEAAMRAAGIAPGLIRKRYAFEKWPWIEKGLLRSRIDAISPERTQPTVAITARDNDPAVVEIARRNARRAGVEQYIDFGVADAMIAPPPSETGLVVTNPPYGERIELEGDRAFYQAFGDRLKESYTGWQAWILSANKEAMKGIGLRASSRTQLWNGGLDARLYELRIYARDPE